MALLFVATVMLLGGAWDATRGASRGDVPEPVAGPAQLRSFGETTAVVAEGVRGVIHGVVTLRPDESASGVWAVMQAPSRLWRGDRLTFVFASIIVVLAVGLFGTAVARMAAMQVAARAHVGVVESIAFAASVWIRAVGALLAPVIFIGLVALALLVPALMLKVPGLNVLAGLSHAFTLALGLAAALVAIGSMITWPGLLPVVACENVDSVEALQRVLAILVRRPVQVAAMIAMAVIGMAIGYVVVAGTIAITLNITSACANTFDPATAAATPGGAGIFALGPAIEDGAASARLSGTASVAAGFLLFWQRLLVSLVAAWVVSYFFTAATHVYLAARDAADGQEPSDIWMPGQVRGTNVTL